MRTCLKIFGVSALFFSSGLSACSSETVETEMQRWCDCEHQAGDDVQNKAQCAEIMKDITRKYEFDPEAVVKIQTKILECRQ